MPGTRPTLRPHLVGSAGPAVIPPSESMMRCLLRHLLIPVRSAISFTIPTAASVSVYPGATEFTRIPFEATSLDRPLL
jgi:hypothetical protein